MITYCTAIWTHHQSEVCRELHNILGDDFRMVLTLPLDAQLSRERMAMGWNLTPPDEDWIVGPPKTVAEARQVDYSKYIVDPDVAVLGWIPEVPDSLVMRRVRSGKLTFFQSERLFKQKPTFKDWLNPFYLKWRLSLWRKLHPKNVHFLTLSYWCVEDLEALGVCRGRTWKWGYLTAVSDRPTEKPKHTKVRIGWCGRFLCWKNVSDILQASSLLENSAKAEIEVVLVGDGPERDNLVRMSRDLGLDNIVTFKPFLPQKEALAFMESIDIFPFPSNRLEGWGAILPEAMDKCCAVVASEDAGATLMLVEDGGNGFTYRAGDVAMLSKRIAELVNDTDLRRRFGLAAWHTMQKWTPRVGAKALVGLISALRSGDETKFSVSGLCSRVR